MPARQPRNPVPSAVHPSFSEGLCPECGGDRLTEIAMTLTDGSPVRFRSCRKCEAKTWEQGGDPLPLEVVMDKARKPRG